MTAILTSDPGKAVFQNAAVQIAVNHLPDIRAGKDIFLFKMLLVNLLEVIAVQPETSLAKIVKGGKALQQDQRVEAVD